MRLLEVVRGQATSSAALATGLRVAKQLKKCLWLLVFVQFCG